MSRRRWVLGACGLVVSPALGCARSTRSAVDSLAEIERRAGGRLGVHAIDTGTGAVLARRDDERFAMCSTFKFVLAAAVLARVDAGREDLARSVPYDAAAMLEYAPATRAHLGDGAMTVGALCDAAVTVSDNTAANLLLATLGGPAGLTRYFRSVGDEVSRLDRDEPTLNTALPGDARDTTTPRAMAHTARRLLLGDALSPASRARLVGWMEACTTGGARLRAGLPRGWRAGDKTGTGANGATCDVAVVWPPAPRAPWIVAAYLMGSAASTDVRNAALADTARAVARSFGAT